MSQQPRIGDVQVGRILVGIMAWVCLDGLGRGRDPLAPEGDLQSYQRSFSRALPGCRCSGFVGRGLLFALCHQPGYSRPGAGHTLSVRVRMPGAARTWADGVVGSLAGTKQGSGLGRKGTCDVFDLHGMLIRLLWRPAAATGRSPSRRLAASRSRELPGHADCEKLRADDMQSEQRSCQLR